MDKAQNESLARVSEIVSTVKNMGVVEGGCDDDNELNHYYQKGFSKGHNLAISCMLRTASKQLLVLSEQLSDQNEH